MIYFLWNTLFSLESLHRKFQLQIIHYSNRSPRVEIIHNIAKYYFNSFNPIFYHLSSLLLFPFSLARDTFFILEAHLSFQNEHVTCTNRIG